MKFSNSITLNYLKILMSNDNLGFLSNATGKSNYELLAREEILTQNLFNLLQENGYVSLQNFFIFDDPNVFSYISIIPTIMESFWNQDFY